MGYLVVRYSKWDLGGWILATRLVVRFSVVRFGP